MQTYYSKHKSLSDTSQQLQSVEPCNDNSSFLTIVSQIFASECGNAWNTVVVESME